MEATNERYREILREVGERAANALATQPENPNQAFVHLDKALAGIELRVYTARRGLDVPNGRAKA